MTGYALGLQAYGITASGAARWIDACESRVGNESVEGEDMDEIGKAIEHGWMWHAEDAEGMTHDPGCVTIDLESDDAVAPLGTVGERLS